MLILNIIDNGLVCDCGVSRVLIMTYHGFCKKYLPYKWIVLIVYCIWYITFIKSYYFLRVKKTIKEINRNMCLFNCKLIIMAYLSVQYILFYN